MHHSAAPATGLPADVPGKRSNIEKPA